MFELKPDPFSFLSTIQITKKRRIFLLELEPNFSSKLSGKSTNDLLAKLEVSYSKIYNI